MGGKSKGDAGTSGGARIGMPADFRIADVMDMHRQLRDAQKRGHQVSWAGASAPLYDAASQLGLAQTLALPAKQSA